MPMLLVGLGAGVLGGGVVLIVMFGQNHAVWSGTDEAPLAKNAAPARKARTVTPEPNDVAPEKPLPVISKPGRVRVTVTWQFNNFVGTKPDTDATVLSEAVFKLPES